jgi:hypothetical protein
MMKARHTKSLKYPTLFISALLLLSSGEARADQAEALKTTTVQVSNTSSTATPAVRITAPASGATVSGTVTITGNNHLSP